MPGAAAVRPATYGARRSGVPGLRGGGRLAGARPGRPGRRRIPNGRVRCESSRLPARGERRRRRPACGPRQRRRRPAPRAWG
ncbi:MAG: hypothetical protein F4W95_08295 [Chloroflexi bacterium]|nr:hypothetical protein [Chloroflexota bacterium]MYD48472.1 hypothetical protein [Chloroflexota bacterium]